MNKTNGGPAEGPAVDDQAAAKPLIGDQRSAADLALEYAAAGLSVLPLHRPITVGCSCGRRDCHSPGKHPRIEHGKDDATTDVQTITGWWSRWPDANIGVRPPIGIVVLDVDPRNGGASALAELETNHGPLPPTLTAWTGSGGLHIWYAYAGPSVGRLCAGVDVKTHTGYLVAPPSMHSSGGHYMWANDLATAPAPRWVRSLLTPPRVVPGGTVHRAGSGGIEHLVRVVADAGEGQLNNRLYWAAVRAHEGGLDSDPLVDAAVAKGHPERGARRTVTSAVNAASRGRRRAC